MNYIYRYLIIIFICVSANPIFALCGGPLNRNAFNSPLDFNDPTRSKTINLVEQYHFTPNVESLIRGEHGSIAADLHYTLKSIPNHYRALYAMAKWQIRNGKPLTNTGEYWTIDCYFERALTFKPNDPKLHLLHGIYLHKIKEYGLALKSYKIAESLTENYSELFYNMGLCYYDMGNYEKAKYYAEKAYSNNYPLPGLKLLLKNKGVWKNN